jgi:hypothetical protein
MTQEQLKIEINHILESGANEIRLLELINKQARSKWDEACEAQTKECSRCLEVDIPKSPTHNLVLYAPKPEFKP